MRILILTKKVPYPVHDGESIAIMQFASHFASVGIEVQMLSMQTQKHNYKIDEIPTDFLNSIKLTTVFVQTKINYSHIFKNLFKRIPYQFERFYSKNYIDMLNAILEKYTFDIIQLEGFFLVSYIPEIRKKSNAKIVLRSHNIEHRIWKTFAKNENNWFKKIFLLYQSNKMSQYETLHTNEVDAIVPISLSDEKWYQYNTSVQKIKYIPCGIESHLFIEKNTTNDRKFYFIGGLDWLPNIQGITWFIQKVLPLVLDKIPNFKLHVAGRNASKQLISLFKDSIQFYGEVDDAISFIHDKEFCIVPLLSGSGMKIKIAEAFMHKKIVISTSIGIEGYPEGIKDVMYLADSPIDFANAIIQINENKSSGDLKKEASYHFAMEHFESTKLTSSLIKFYTTL